MNESQKAIQRALAQIRRKRKPWWKDRTRFVAFLPGWGGHLERKMLLGWWVRTRTCATCNLPVRLTLGAGKPGKRELRSLGIRCCDCLGIFCLKCAFAHFGKDVPLALLTPTERRARKKRKRKKRRRR